MRAFIFSVWAHVGSTSADTLAALKDLAARQYTVAEQGGRHVVSASLQGKSFTYEMPAGQTGMDFTQMCYDAWRQLTIGGASGGWMTDDELDLFLSDKDGENTNVTVATFTQRIR